MGSIKKTRLYNFSSDQAAKIPIDDRKVEAELDQLVVAVNNTVTGLNFANSPYTITASNESDLYLCDATSGAITITLDTVGDHTDEKITFVKTDSSANAVTPNGVPLANQNESVSFVSDGTTWHHLSGGASTFSVSSSTWPSFSVHRNGVNQTGLSGVTKVEFTDEIFDTNNNFDSVTNYRFTPTVAGKYLLSACVRLGTAPVDGDKIEIHIYTNGSDTQAVYRHVYTTNATQSVNITAVVTANGIGDYFEILFGSANNEDILGTIENTYFTGCRIG